MTTPFSNLLIEFNVSKILTYINHLPSDDRFYLFGLIGIKDEEELQSMFHGNLVEQEKLSFNLEYRIHKIITVYIPPLLLFLGTFGNICAFFVLRHKTMARSSTHMFLAALSIADSLVLIFGLLRMWIGELAQFELRDKTDWLCKSIMFLGYILSDFAAWLIVAVTVERYIVIVHPLKALRLCKVSRAKKVILGIIGFFVLVHLHFFWTVGLYRSNDGQGQLKCDSSPSHRYLIYIIWPWIDALLYSFMPFFIIIIFNILIISRVYRSNNGRKMEEKLSLRRFSGRHSNNVKSNYRLTVMLLSVSFTFLLTTLPMNIGIICAFLWNEQSHDVYAMSKFRLFITIAELLMYLNHSIKFFLYCATGQRFRYEILKMVRLKFGLMHVTSFDHSQHIYCSRKCSVNHAYRFVRKSIVESEL